MIELINVSKYYPTEFGKHYVFRNVTLTLPMHINIAVIGPNGAGKSTFLRLLGGADMPSEGRVLRTGLISPPMGLTPGLQQTMTGGENTRFACRIYGMTREQTKDTVERVQKLADIGKFFDMPVHTYSAGMRQRVAFAISMSMHFDYYLFDEIGAGGDTAFRRIARRMVQERLDNSNFIIASHRLDEMVDLCQSAILIKDGELTYFEDINDALAAYQLTDGDEEDEAEFAARRRRRRGLGAEKSEDARADEAVAAAIALTPEERAVARLERGHQQRLGARLEAAPEVPPPVIPVPLPAAAPVVYKPAPFAKIPILPAPEGLAPPPPPQPPSPEKVPAVPPVIRKSALAQVVAATKAARAQRLLLLLLEEAAEPGTKRMDQVVEAAVSAQVQASEAAAKARDLSPATAAARERAPRKPRRTPVHPAAEAATPHKHRPRKRLQQPATTP